MSEEREQTNRSGEIDIDLKRQLIHNQRRRHSNRRLTLALHENTGQDRSAKLC